MNRDDPDEDLSGADAVELPITDVLDLHSFRPAEVPDVVRDYLDAAAAKGYRQLRIIHPVAVDRSVVYTYSFRMKNAPARMFRDTVAFANVVNGTGSWGLTDDLEGYECIQGGFSPGAGPASSRATSRSRTWAGTHSRFAPASPASKASRTARSSTSCTPMRPSRRTTR